MAQTIKEFLVSLGFKVDGNSEARFSRSIEVATKGAIALGAAVAAASVAVTAAVTKIAAGFDELYYASQRTKASAENIKAVGFAVSQLGGSYQGAVSSIEAFALKMRSNPGYETMARSLGVVTRENGKLRDTTVIMTDLARMLSKRPTHETLQFLEAFGIDERTYDALKSGDLVRYTEEYRKKQEALGVTQSRAADVGRELSNAWRSLSATAAAVGDKLLVSLGPGIKDFVDRVDGFLMRNADKIVSFFERAAEWVGKLLAAFVQLVEKGEGPMVEFFDKIVAGVDKMEKAFVAFAAFLGGAFLLSVLASFSKVGAGFAGMLLKLGINPLTLGIGGALALSTGSANAGEDQEIARRRANGTWGNNGFDGTNPAPKDSRNWWQRTMPRVLGGRDSPAQVQASAANIPPEGRALLDTIASTEANSYDVMYGGKKFDSYADHPRVNVPITSGPNAGRTSSAAGRYQFLGRTWDQQKRKLGLPDFSPASQDIAAYDLAKTVYRQKTGRDLDADLKSKDPAVLSGIGSALAGTWTSLPGGIEQGQGAGRFVSSFNKFLERQLKAAEKTAAAVPSDQGSPFIGSAAPKDQGSPFLGPVNPQALKNIQSNAAVIGGGAQAGGGAPLMPAASNTNVDLNQKTEITILGGGDPQATAREVAGAQDKVNGGLLRNMTGAVR